MPSPLSNTRLFRQAQASALSGMLLLFCVLVPAPLMPLVALVLFPPQKELLSNKRIRPPFSTTVLAADIPAKPPPTTITWLAGNTAAMVVFGCELQVGAQRGMVVSQLLEPEQVDVKRGCVPGTGTGIFWKASNAQQKCANLFHRLLVSYCLVLIVTCCDYIALFHFSLFGVSSKMILAKQ